MAIMVGGALKQQLQTPWRALTSQLNPPNNTPKPKSKIRAVWPLYWLVQGTMMWAVFVVGHDCGHGSFSDSRTLNDAVGHLLHSLILVPYHGWRLRYA
jgi:hypothetical protein